MDKNIEDRYVVILAVLTQFIACFVGAMITIALKDMQMDLSLNSWQVNLLSIIYYIVMISISLPISKVVSNFGIKRYLKLNMFLLIFSLFLAGFAVNAEMLIIARILQGVCFAAFAVSVYVIVVKQISDEKLGPVLGLVSSAGYVGMTSAPTVSGFIISFLDWRWTFIFMIIFCVIAVWVTTRIETEWKEETPFNVTGSVFYFISMLMITMGIFSLDSIGIIPIAIGLISLAIFVKTERGKKNQIFNLDIFKNIEVDIGSFAAVSSNYITYVLTHIITLFLLYVKDVSPHIGGMILLVTPVTMIIVSPISGRLTNRFDSRILCAVALVLLVITLAMMTVLEELPFALLIVAMVLQGMGHALFSPANTKNVLTTVDDEDVANASAFLSTSKDFGKSISIGIFNVICAFVGLNFDKISEVNEQLLVASDIAISIAIIPAVISIILLIYSKYKFAENVNIKIWNFLKSMAHIRG